MKMPVQTVWPVRVPTPETIIYGLDSWDRYEEKFRPHDYLGGRFDRAAWRVYVLSKAIEKQTPMTQEIKKILSSYKGWRRIKSAFEEGVGRTKVC